MKKAIAIARVSSEKQAAEDKVSHEEQLTRIRQWAEGQGYQVVDEFREVLSGATELDPEHKELRPKFWRAWDSLKAGEIQAIIFWEPSRFCRDKTYSGLKAATYVVDSYRYGDGIRFVVNEPDRTNEFAPFILFAQTFGAAQELRTMGRRFEMGQKGALAKGQKGRGRDPFGYRGNPETKQFEVVASEAEIIKSIFTRYAAGESLRDLSFALSEADIGSPDAQRGHKAGVARWQSTTVSRILTRDYYASGIKNGTFMGDDYSQPLPPIIDAQLFERVQERLKNARHFPRRLHTRGLFQGLIRCGSCGRTYHRGSYGGKQSANYFCPGRSTQTQRMDGTPKCHSPSLKMVDADAALWRALLTALRDPKGLAKQFLDRVESEIITLQPGLGSYSDLQALQEKRNMAVKLLTRPGISPETVEETIIDLDGQIERCANRLNGKENEVRRLQGLRQQERSLRKIIDNDHRAILEVNTLMPVGPLTEKDVTPTSDIWHFPRRVIFETEGSPQQAQVVDVEDNLTDWLESQRLILIRVALDLEPPLDLSYLDNPVVAIAHDLSQRVTTADALLEHLSSKVTVLPDGRLELVADSLYVETELQSAVTRSSRRPLPDAMCRSLSCPAPGRSAGALRRRGARRRPETPPAPAGRPPERP